MPKITEDDRLRLENRALTRILGEFAALTPTVREDTGLRLQQLVRRSRNLLQAIAQQKRAPKPQADPLEVAAYSVAHYANLLINRRGEGAAPLLCLDRLGPRSWEAYLDEHEELPVGQGSSALEAVQRLNSNVKQAWQRFTRENRQVVEVRELR